MNLLKKFYKKIPNSLKYIFWKYPKHIFNNYISLNIFLSKISKRIKSYALPDLTTKIIIDNKYSVILDEPELKIVIFGYFLNYFPKEGDIIVDAGAYPGDFSIIASYFIGKTGKILCFEPDKKNAKIMKNNFKKYNIKNAKIIEKGLWSKKSRMYFENEGIYAKISNKKKGYYIDVTDLDSELKNQKIKKVDFIKMDIEGSEIEALKGMAKTLKNNSLNLAIASYHRINGEMSYKKCEEFLLKKGYKTFTSYKRHLTTYGFKG